jgi:hypothetical protein
MSKAIEINFTWSKELAIKASKLYYDYDMRNSRKRYVGWLFIALTQFGIVGALKHDAYGMLYLSTFLVIYWYYIRWYIRKSMIVKFYNNSNTDNTKVSFTLEDDGLHFDDKVIDFENILKVVKFDDGVLIQTSTNTLFFEKAAFNSVKEMNKFISVMREKGKI